MAYVLGIVIGKPQELLELLDIGWCWPGPDGLNLVRISPNVASFHNVPQVLHRGLPKLTFLALGKELFLPEPLKHCPKVLQVLWHIRTEHQDVIQVHTQTLVQKVLKGEVHDPLESCRSISQA